MYDNYTRDPKHFSFLKNKGDTIVTGKNISILFPFRFNKVGLVDFESGVTVVCVVMIVDEASKKYTLINNSAKMNLLPARIQMVRDDKDVFYKLDFEKDNVVISNKNFIKSSLVTPVIIKEFLIKGNIPSYLGYEDLTKLFITSNKFAGSKLGGNRVILETLVSIIYRSESKPKTPIRMLLTGDKEKDKKLKIVRVPLNNIYTGYNTNYSRLTGAYFNDAVTAIALDTDSVKPDIEDILKKYK